MPDIEIEIDGKPLKAAPDRMLIQVADEAGIYIPRFCYHKHLSIAANCRMCLVEVEKAPKPLPACATPVMPGMKVFTRSAKALAAQKAVMEFLLINHPLDCPICDQGGECELQDLSMGYGAADSYYHEGKRSVKDQDIGPLVATDMTRCIQCTRCVRFGDEIAGLRELGATGRGENMEIGTYVEKAMQSEVSGNIIDLCPVGALTSKPFRFTARAWELQQQAAIAPHDCVGANINVHTRTGTVMRVIPRENVAINETWISDRDRYSYEGLYHDDRLTTPLIRHNKEWKAVDWQTALQTAAMHLQRVQETHGGNAIGALASPNSTLEEFYLLQKILRQLGSPHIDHRLRQVDFQDEFSPGVSHELSELDESDCILLIGSNIQREQPSLALRVRKAYLQGARILAINMLDHAFHFKLAHKKITAPHHFVKAVAGVAKALTADADLNEIELSEIDHAFADAILNAKKLKILLGAQALNHPEASAIRLLVRRIANKMQTTVGFLTEGCNAQGAYLAGVIPHEGGLNAQTMLQDPRKAYLLLNVEPELDCSHPALAVNALKQADCIIALSLFKNPVLMETAQVILPMAAFGENTGTFVNVTGRWQSFQAAALLFADSKPAWKILRVLGHFLNFSGFDYQSPAAIAEEVKNNRPELKNNAESQTLKFKTTKKITRIGEIPIYSGDSIVRRAYSLQKAESVIEGDVTELRLHESTAKRLKLHDKEKVSVCQNGQAVIFSLKIDDRVPPDGAYIAGGITHSFELGELFGEVDIKPIEPNADKG